MAVRAASPTSARAWTDGSALIGTIDTYLVYRLTGGAVFATDHTNACRTLLYNIRTLDWDGELCALFDVPPQALTPACARAAPRSVKRRSAARWTTPIPICGVMGDSQAALFAERCFEPGMAKVTFGTGSSVLLNIGDQVTLSPNGIVTTIGWVYQRSARRMPSRASSISPARRSPGCATSCA